MLQPHRTLLTAVAALAMIAIAVTPVAADHHPSHDEEACEGTSVDEQAEVCGQVSITLVGDTQTTVEEIISRSAPDATVEDDSASANGHYLLSVPVGSEVENRDSLQADPDVEQASFVQLGWLTVSDGADDQDEDGTDSLPDTATSTAALTLASLLGILMLGSAILANVAIRGRRR